MQHVPAVTRLFAQPSGARHVDAAAVDAFEQACGGQLGPLFSSLRALP